MTDNILALFWIIGLFIVAGFLAGGLLMVHERLTHKKENR